MSNDLTTKLVLELIDKATAPLKEVQSSLRKLTSIQKEITQGTSAATNATRKATDALKGNTLATEKDTLAKKEQKGALDSLGKSLVELGTGLEVKNKLQEILEVGKEYQSMRFRLSAVLGVDMANKDLDNYIKKFKGLAANGLGTYDEVADTGYALFSAGIDKNDVMSGTETALGVARITKGNAEDVANIMATASKDFRVSMARVGDVFTKAQIKFQIKDFQQLEEGLKYVAATAATMKVPLEQATTALGALNNAGKNGSMAGTGLNDILNRVTKVSKSLKIVIPHDKDGSLNLMGWMQQVMNKVRVQADAIQKKDPTRKITDIIASIVNSNKMFGTIGGGAFAVMMNYQKELPEYLGDIKNHSQGIVQTNIAKYYQTFAAKTIALHSATTNLYAAIAESVIPMFSSMLGAITPLITATASLISNHHWLGEVIFITAGALAAFLIIAGSNKLILKPMIETVKDLSRVFKILRLNTLFTSAAMLVWKGVMLVSNQVMKVLRLTTVLFNAVLWANPLTLIISGIVVAVGALAFAVYEVIKHWATVKKFFSVWNWIKTGFSSLVDWIKSLWDSIAGIFEKVIGYFKGNKKVEVTHKVVNSGGGNISDLPINNSSNNTAKSDNSKPNNTYHVTHNTTIHVHGITNPDEVAEAVNKKLQAQNQLLRAH